jgi:hypothetical protein
LIGRVTETAPTLNTGVGGAIVTVTSAGANKTGTTNSMGYYSIADVSPGSAVRVSADGYLDLALLTGRSETNFHLMPAPRLMDTTMSDVLSTQVGTCSDGVLLKPCHILTLAIHNKGPLKALLSWDEADEANLDLSLFRTGAGAFIARSASPGSAPERINVDLVDGATYELRVTYASGAGAPRYTLQVTHQS